MSESKRKDRGTEITLHLSEDSIEFNEEYRILDMLKKFCRFLPYPIQFGMEKTSEPIEGEKDKDGNQKYKDVERPRIINNTDPLWKKTPTDLKDEDYKSFYRELYPYTFDEPLFNIHINVDYPFNLTGILYFPKLKKNLEVQRNKIQLYSNQVFVTDNVENIVPDFLTLLHGVIDSPDIPLNVSRSYLQGDPNVKKISSHITKKVADKLEELYKNSREDFEKKWDDIRVFIRYGMISTESFAERAEKFALLKDTENKYFTLDEYKEKIKEAQTDKDDKLVILYTTDKEEQHTYISAAQTKGYSVLELDSVIDIHFIDFLERKNEKISFKRVDAELTDKLIDKNVETIVSKLNEDESKKVEELFKGALPADVQVFVKVEAAAEDSTPVSMMQPEFMRRMSDMSQLGGMDYMAGMGRSYTLLVNSNHPVVTGLVDSSDEEKNKNVVSQLIDLALLSQGLLKGEKLSRFINRSIDIIK
jgi:molecular chaperone HtpG